MEPDLSLLTPFTKMMTTRNVGAIDRLIRFLPTPLVAYLVYTGILSGLLAWTLGIMAAMLLITTLTGSCSIYYFCGFSTCPISGRTKDPQ